jgi:ArsR family transcriptional regulator
MKKTFDELETLFKALADTTRLRILALLLDGEVCVCDIHGALKILQPRASRHLAYLRRSGLVEARRQGLWVHYRLAEPSDELARTVLSSVRHILGHLHGQVPAGKRRSGRKAAKAPPPGPGSLPVLACCAGTAEKRPGRGDALLRAKEEDKVGSPRP